MDKGGHHGDRRSHTFRAGLCPTRKAVQPKLSNPNAGIDPPHHPIRSPEGNDVRSVMSPVPSVETEVDV